MHLFKPRVITQLAALDCLGAGDSELFVEEMKRSVLNQIQREASSSSSHRFGSVWMASICFSVGRSAVHGMAHRSAKCCWAHLGVRQRLNGRALQGLIAWRWRGINIRRSQRETLKILSHNLCCGKGGEEEGDIIQTSISIVLLSLREKRWLCSSFPPPHSVQSFAFGEEGICSIAVALARGF